MWFRGFDILWIWFEKKSGFVLTLRLSTLSGSSDIKCEHAGKEEVEKNITHEKTMLVENLHHCLSIFDQLV